MGLGLVNTANSLLTQELTNPIDKTIELIVMNPVTCIGERLVFDWAVETLRAPVCDWI